MFSLIPWRMSLAARLTLAITLATMGFGGVVIGFIRPYSHQPWSAEERWDRMDHWFFWTLTTFLVLNAGMVWFSLRRWGRAVRQLAEAAERVGAGDLAPLLLVARDDEIGQLIQRFQQMIEALAWSRQEIERQTEHLERQNRGLLALHKVAAAAHRSLRLEEILEAVLDEILERFQLQAGWVFIVSETSGALELRAHRGLSAALVAAEQSAQNPCICTEAQSWQGPVSGRPHCPRTFFPDLGQEGLRSHVCVPLVAQGRVRGVLHLASDVADRFAPEDLAVLTALGQQIGVALENASLFTRAQLEAAQFSALFEISKALISLPRLPEILQLIAAKAAEVIGSDFCSLLLLEPETQRLRVQAVYGLICHCRGGHPLHRCEAIAQEAIRQQRTQIIEDFTAYSGLAVGFHQACDRLAYLISVPLRVRDRPIGVLNVGAATPRQFTSHDVELLELFSHLASIAIENARLMVTSVLLPEVHHRVKNNLQDIASLLSLQVRRLRSPEAQGALRDAIQRVKGLALVHDLMSHSSPECLDLMALVQEIKSRMLQALAAPEQALVIEVEGSPLRLPSPLVQSAALVLNELASNALKHAFRDRDQGYLRIAVAERDGQVELTIQDDGPGFPPEVLRGSQRGLGLTIVETLVQRDLNGCLEWSNDPGATVRVTFPKFPALS
jgi:two-component sensor histidine kinase/HAMP domain-containing protein